MLPKELVHSSSRKAASGRPRGVAANPRPQEHEVLIAAEAIVQVHRENEHRPGGPLRQDLIQPSDEADDALSPHPSRDRAMLRRREVGGDDRHNKGRAAQASHAGAAGPIGRRAAVLDEVAPVEHVLAEEQRDARRHIPDPNERQWCVPTLVNATGRSAAARWRVPV